MIKPARGKILCSKAELTKTGSIYLPDNKTNEPPVRLKVIAIGDKFINKKGRELKYPCMPKDTIIVKRWASKEVKNGYIVGIEDVIAVI